MSFQQQIEGFLLRGPTVAACAWIAPGAAVVGDVTLGEQSSVWYSAVLRGDINRIVVGPRSNVQDGAVIHVADEFETRIGELVTIGHKAVVHACTLGDEVLVGMGAIILDGAEIGPRCIIGAGALITGGKKIPEGSLVLGSPAKVVRILSREEQESIKVWATRYVTVSQVFRAQSAAVVATK